MNKLYIQDNLITLKLLDANSIDCIYTDPPYLTGNNKLTYKDDKKESEWITFMEERLVQCHRVMKPSATIILHIDERMHIELATLMNKVFGKKNKIGTFCWKKRASAAMQSKFMQVQHEYILAYAKDKKKCKWNGIPQFEAKDITTELKQDDPKEDSAPHPNGDSLHKLDDHQEPDGRPNQRYPLYVHGDDPQDKLHGLNNDPSNGKGKCPASQSYPLYVYDAQRLDKVSKTDRTPETRPNATYPLYVGQDEVDFYAEKQLKIFNANNETRDSDNKYPLYSAPHPNGDSASHPNGDSASHPNGDTDQQRISLTPFPGSIEIKPLNGKELGCWRCIPATARKLIDANMLVVKNGKIYQKQYANYQFNKKTGKLEPFVRTTPINSILMGDNYPTNTRSNKEIKEIFGSTLFTYSKPSLLVENLIKVISQPGDVICDPFAGSGTTGEAAHRCGRKFILMQIDENNIPELIKIRLNKKVGAENYEVIDETNTK